MLHLAFLFALQLAADVPADASYDGTCIYPEVLRQRVSEGELVNCNRVEVGSNHVSFGLRGWQSRTRFNGRFEGDRMTVASVTLANGRSYDARGTCEIFYTDDAVSTLACSAQSNRGAMLANFVRSRVNDPR